jgi:diguanylate cyclase (GGDEF)-like protein/PAS domain S-box-containing protein
LPNELTSWTLEAFDRLSDGCIALDREWRYTYVNQAAGDLLGREPEALIGRHVWTEFPTPVDNPFRVAYQTAMSQQRTVTIESFDDVRSRWYENRIYASDDGLTVVFIDVTERKSAEIREQGQNRILEGIAAHRPLSESLTEIARLHERLNPHASCSLLLLTPDGGHVQHGAAPSLPEAFASSIDGLAIGESHGSCGTAAAIGQQVIVGDIETHPFWENYRHLALPHGLRACWSTPVLSSSGDVLGTFAVYYRTPREPSQAELRSINAMLSITAIAIESDHLIARLRERDCFFELSTEIYCIYDTTTRRIIQTNPMFRTVTGYSTTDLHGRHYTEFVHPDDVPSVRAAIGKVSPGATTPSAVEFRYLCKDGRYRWMSWQSIFGPDHLAFSVARDVTGQRDADAALEHASRHDGLTGLPGRALVEAAIGDALDQHTTAWVLVVGLDRFHSVNESMGHDIGDHVLRATAHRLRSIAPDALSVGRFASDKFVVVVADTDESTTTELGDRVRAAVSEPIDTEDYRLVLTASVGVSHGPLHGASAQDLLARAEAAMVSAKWLGGDTTFHFSTEQMRDIEERLQLGRQLRHAVASGDLELHYQPQHCAEDGVLTGLEALLRWTDPEWGRIAPDRFIPIAETVGLMPEIGHWVLDEACRQARAWLDASHPPIPIAVNISAQELRRGGLVERVNDALRRHSLPASAITLELTESTLMENVERATATMNELTELGTAIALDDFGTGYSSLAYIKNFPISKIKIDKSFVSGLPDDTDDVAIVRSVVAMAHQLGIIVAAEGVETEEQRQFLASGGCDELQGYLLGRPAPAAETELLFGTT